MYVNLATKLLRKKRANRKKSYLINLSLLSMQCLLYQTIKNCTKI